jgi:hypothetical protein
MRKDLAEQGIKIPAGMAYRNYDDLMYVEYFSADDLNGAEEYATGEDPDDHAFCPVKLKDGRWFYFIGIDLDWIGS